MRLVTYRKAGVARVGALVGKKVVDLAEASVAAGATPIPPCMIGLLDMGAKGIRTAKAAVRYAEGHPEFLESLRKSALLAPVPRPRKLLALAGNYAEHIKESYGKARAKKEMTPRVFMMPPTTTVNHPGANVPMYKKLHFLDWEVELAIVMGRKAKYVSAKDAPKYIVGYTIVNDITERAFKVRNRTKEEPIDGFFDWLNGKWGDGFAPMGPCIVTSDEIGDPQNLDLSLQVNGKTMQDSNTSKMLFSCAELVSYISQWVTLEPGDVIATGTPHGIGKPQGIRLKANDIVKATIQKIGTLQNKITAK